MMYASLIQTLGRLRQEFWIRIAGNVMFGVLWFIIELLILTLVLYIAGRAVVGEKRAKISDAFIVALLGTVLSSLFTIFIPYGLIAVLLSILVWLLLIKRLYETSWLGALAVGILAIMIFIAILFLMALFLGVLYGALEWFTLSLA
ncbi:MAG: hypothetical protein N3F10_02535 [Candidatus Bathyarchaeota archaeon]|nr:hypothetical protein [Candidatus Bathyarchaeota archaeon]MCX8177160.1 hypothetical protein [Candidatus Bathyarchaeota archaeon]MDW8193674.1 hypothetical protein [Nitrososphaerota archaeon]